MNKIIPLWKLNYFKRSSRLKGEFTIDKCKHAAFICILLRRRPIFTIISHVARAPCQFYGSRTCDCIIPGVYVIAYFTYESTTVEYYRRR